MGSPSPSDHMWVIGYSPEGRWIAPVMRAAVRAEWRSAQLAAKAQLGDVKLAHELMEAAIGETKEYLADSDPVEIDDARKILARFFRNAVRRKQRSDLRFRGIATNIEALAPTNHQPSSAIDARLDLDTILRDTPPEIRYALLARYGARRQWEDVAVELQKSKDALRVRCERELSRIRRRLKIGPRPD